MTLKPLLDKLTPYLPDYPESGLTNLLVLVLAMLNKRTVCLNKLKCAVGGILGNSHTRVDSHYIRLIRFFNTYSASDLWLHILRCGLQLLPLKTKYLVLDGSSWQRGQTWRHYITLCVVYRGVAIPILWQDLAKKGSSSTQERITLFDLALEHFSLAGKVLLADREYIGVDWFNYLLDKQIDFVIRSRDYSYFSLIDSGSEGLSVEGMIAKVMRSKKANKALKKAFRLSPDGAKLWIVVAKNPCPEGKEEFMILITSLDQKVYATVADYLKRWKIEHCFGQLKSNGFDLEVINLGSPVRRRLLMAVTVLAYILSVTEGLKDYHERVAYKRHGSDGRSYRAVSVFRYGIDQLSATLRTISQGICYLTQNLHQATTGYRSTTLLNV